MNLSEKLSYFSAIWCQCSFMDPLHYYSSCMPTSSTCSLLFCYLKLQECSIFVNFDPIICSRTKLKKPLILLFDHLSPSTSHPQQINLTAKRDKHMKHRYKVLTLCALEEIYSLLHLNYFFKPLVSSDGTGTSTSTTTTSQKNIGFQPCSIEFICFFLLQLLL